MEAFDKFNLSKQLQKAISDLGFDQPTPIQSEAFSVILSGKDMVGISQTGTGKTIAYLLPLLQWLKYSEQISPRILILVPTRELVLQLVEHIEVVSKYTNTRVLGVYGGANINLQKQAVLQGTDILVATPGRLYDLILSNILKLKEIKKLVIDEVDVMLDLGFRFQLSNILELLPVRRQNIMLSATMTDEVFNLIQDHFVSPVKISIAVSGTRLKNISQECYQVANFNTKINLLNHLLSDSEEFSKVIVFAPSKKNADMIFEALEDIYKSEIGILHSNKTQNFRIKSIKEFDEGIKRILVATDVMSRGIDLEKVTHVINFDTPGFPENYIHRIGRSGRAEQPGKSILFYTKKEEESKVAIENLMSYKIPMNEFPGDVEISTELISDEKPKIEENFNRNTKKVKLNPGFHEKKEKNKKTNTPGGAYGREKAKKYKKPKTRGDKNFNKRKRK